MTVDYFGSDIRGLNVDGDLQYFHADTFPTINPVFWLTSHFAVGGYSPLRRLSGMLTAHMTQIAPRNGFRWHPHRGLEIYTYVTELPFLLPTVVSARAGLSLYTSAAERLASVTS